MKDQIVNALSALAFFTFTAIFFAVLILEWAVGCGTVTHNADGTWQTGACVVVPHEQAKGDQ